MPIDRAMADYLLTTTRAVRKRLDLTRPVPREVIVDCIRISQQAPTASNSQTWSWVVVDDAPARRALAKIYQGIIGDAFEKAGTASRSAQTARVYDSAKYLCEHLHEVPVHVIPCIGGRESIIQEEAFFASIYPAVWSFQLALRARGLGSVLTTAHLFKADEVAKLLGIPAGMRQAALLPVAYTMGEDFKPAARPAPESIIHWNGW
jgi:nitroreductase